MVVMAQRINIRKIALIHTRIRLVAYSGGGSTANKCFSIHGKIYWWSAPGENLEFV